VKLHSRVALQVNVNLATEVALVRVNLPSLSDSAANDGSREGELHAITEQLLQVVDSSRAIPSHLHCHLHE
jgi:hypothetical protein